MSYQDRLLRMLESAFTVQRTGDARFLLSLGDRTVELLAEEADVAACTKAFAASGLQVLGPVGDDASGETAGMGLLLVHIEERIGSDEDVTQIVVGPDGINWDS